MRPSRARFVAADSASASRQAATKPARSAAIRTTSPYKVATSLIGVLTAGFPAAMYSRVLVGLMNRVDSFRANGSSPTFQPSMSRGSSS